MVLYALDDVEDAFGVTRDFLTGIDRWTWLKLALVVLFVGGFGGGFPTFGTGGGDVDEDAPAGDVAPAFDPGPDFWLFVAAIVAVLVLVALAFLFVAGVMEFVFLESLRTEAVSVREYWDRHWRKGARLFGFRLVLDVVLFGLFLLFLALVAAPAVLGVGLGFSLVLLVVLVPVFLIAAVVAGLIRGFTTTFVAPVMLLEERGVLAGWRRLWPTLKAQWKQYLVYVVVNWLLSLVGGIVFLVIAAVLAAIAFVPFAVLFGVGAGLLAVAEVVGLAWFALSAVLFVLAGLAVWALALTPVQTFLRYYGLLVLGDIEPEFDVIPAQRAAVREPDDALDEGGGPADEGTGPTDDT